jgi:hypothetical protein
MDVAKVLQAVRGYMHTKPAAAPGDVILVGMPSGVFYGLVDGIEPDHKKNWFEMKFKLLILPPVELSWKLRIPQMSGELFTINGEQHFVLPINLRSAVIPDENTDTHEEPARNARGKFALVKGGAG